MSEGDKLREYLEQMEQILDQQGVQKAGIFAHRLPEPFRMKLLKQLLSDVECGYTVFDSQWVQGVIAGRIK